MFFRGRKHIRFKTVEPRANRYQLRVVLLAGRIREKQVVDLPAAALDEGEALGDGHGVEVFGEAKDRHTALMIYVFWTRSDFADRTEAIVLSQSKNTSSTSNSDEFAVAFLRVIGGGYDAHSCGGRCRFRTPLVEISLSPSLTFDSAKGTCLRKFTALGIGAVGSLSPLHIVADSVMRR